MAMTPFLRRILRWGGYLFIGTGIIGELIGVASVAQAFLGSADQRANSIGGAVGGFGGGFANVLLGYGLLWLSRSGADHPDT